MKRLMDLTVVVLAMPLALPVTLFCALLVFLFLGRPVLFRQWRAGLHGRPFRLVKFRTMTAVGDGTARQTDDAARLTRFGRLLRSSSLDELPELWNVLCGEMSLVGPRPLLPEYVALYSERQRHRLDVLPGLTGWAQVNGRNALSWESRFDLDLQYVERRSVLLDLRILMLTVTTVFSRKGIGHGGSDSMPPFEGCRGESGEA